MGKKRVQPHGRANQFTIKMQKKLLVLFGALVLMFSGLIGRLVWIIREVAPPIRRRCTPSRATAPR